MTESERAEYMNLINLWNCTEPMTPAQIARMEELDARIRGMRVGLPKGDSPCTEGRKDNARICGGTGDAAAQHD